MTVEDIRNIENEFFRYFPKSNAKRPFTQMMATAAKRHIKNYQNINGSQPAFTKEDIFEFNRLTKDRKIKSFFELPEKHQEDIKMFIFTYELYYNTKIENLYLTGSFVEGHWRTDETLKDPSQKHLLEMIYKIKGKRGISDVDVTPYPLKGNLDFRSVHVHTAPWEKVLIFSDGIYQ